jgi:predicted lysophospholipase L1 biosynthesis ABC-type transport system permease subunit
LIYWLLLAALILAVVAVRAIPETRARRARALDSLRPRAGLPPQARAMFMIAVPALVALWALGGLYLSLGPSLAGQLLSSHNRLSGGLVIFLLTGTAAAASTAGRSAPRPARCSPGVSRCSAASESRWPGSRPAPQPCS